MDNSGTSKRVLILGASYGALLAVKLQAASHSVKLVCTAKTAALINERGVRVAMPVKGTTDGVELNSKALPGSLSADEPEQIDASAFDLVALAMQEPQYSSPQVRRLVEAIAGARIPVMSVMNMPLLPFLERIPGINAKELAPAYGDAPLWQQFDRSLMTMCSPDPQAVRPFSDRPNELRVNLATNFKAAGFESDVHTTLLRELAAGIEAARFPVSGRLMDLPVKLKVHDSIFVPLAKWPMLLTGNYRCVMPDGVRSIRDAVHSDIELSRRCYEAAAEVCVALGASEQDLVPFEKYAQAALTLASPSSVARALAAGSTRIERVDRLVQLVAAQKNLTVFGLDGTVEIVSDWLRRNRAAESSQAR
jgi:hypothetical protein